MNIDTERLISEVRLRPPLWDLSCTSYKDRDAKIKAWAEICQAIIENYDNASDNEKKAIEKNVQQRWKTARDSYVRCKTTLKNTKSGPEGGNKRKYVYFECMQFLDKKHVADTEDSIAESENTMDEHQTCGKPATNGDRALTSTVPTTSEGSNFCQSKQTAAATEQKNVRPKRFKKRIRGDENDDYDREMLNMLKENTKLMQNDDMSFFCSLLPIMRSFSNHQKLLFRSAVLQKAIEISNSSCDVQPGTSHTFSTSESQNSDTCTISYTTEVPQPQLTDDSSSAAYSLEEFLNLNNL